MSSKFNYLFISILSLFLVFSKNAFGQSKGVSFGIKNGVVTLNGKVIKERTDFTMATVESLLGKPDRVKEGYNTLYTYDNLGVVFFVGKDDQLINEVQISLKSDAEYDYVPKSNFSGTAKVEKTVLGNGTSLEKVQKKLKKYAFVKSLLDDNSYRGEYAKIYVYARFGNENKSVTKISFGFKK